MERTSGWCEVGMIFTLLLAQLWIYPDRPLLILPFAGMFILVSWLTRGETFTSLGLKNGKIAIPALALLAIGAIGSREVGYGFTAGVPALPKLLNGYLWTLGQQIILGSYFTNRIRPLVPDNQSAATAVAIVFSVCHLPNAFLVSVTFVGGIAFSLLFQRYRNVYALALIHLVLSSLLFLSVPSSVHHHFVVGARMLR